MSLRSTLNSFLPSRAWKTPVLKILAGLGLILVGFLGWTTLKLWLSWQSVDRIDFEPSATRSLLEGRSPGELALAGEGDDDPAAGEVPDSPLVTSPRIENGSFQAFLIVGSDARPPYEVSRADVILLVLWPPAESPAIVSLPRDLYLPNPCTKNSTRVNATLLGCEDVATGPELLALTVEDFTGIEIDHFALFDFEGFRTVIDSVGGVEICVENKVFDRKAELNLPAGCNLADGDQALAWVRSRHTQEYVDGRWQAMKGVSDLTRNERQQELLLSMIGKLKSFDTIGELTRKVQSLADAFTVDNGLGINEAVRLAWKVRSLDTTEIKRLLLPVKHFTTSSGAQVLLPDAAFVDILEEAYPGIAADALAFTD